MVHLLSIEADTLCVSDEAMPCSKVGPMHVHKEIFLNLNQEHVQLVIGLFYFLFHVFVLVLFVFLFFVLMFFKADLCIEQILLDRLEGLVFFSTSKVEKF